MGNIACDCVSRSVPELNPFVQLFSHNIVLLTLQFAVKVGSFYSQPPSTVRSLNERLISGMWVVTDSLGELVICPI